MLDLPISKAIFLPLKRVAKELLADRQFTQRTEIQNAFGGKSKEYFQEFTFELVRKMVQEILVIPLEATLKGGHDDKDPVTDHFATLKGDYDANIETCNSFEGHPVISEIRRILEGNAGCPHELWVVTEHNLGLYLINRGDYRITFFEVNNANCAFEPELHETVWASLGE